MKLNCKKCNENFKYKEILNSVVSLKNTNKLKCQNCGAIYKAKIQYRILISFLIALPIFLLLFLPNRLNSQWTYIVLFLIYIIYIVSIALLSPILIKFKIEE